MHATFGIFWDMIVIHPELILDKRQLCTLEARHFMYKVSCLLVLHRISQQRVRNIG